VELPPIAGQLVPVLPDIAVVPLELPPILTHVLPVLSDGAPVLGVGGAVTQRQNYRSHRHGRQRLHRSLRYSEI